MLNNRIKKLETQMSYTSDNTSVILSDVQTMQMCIRDSCGGNPPRRASLVILLGVNSNCPNSVECIALQKGLKNKQTFAIINEARK